jgi:DNA invertase Pin-like site-specific DNA recombinase
MRIPKKEKFGDFKWIGSLGRKAALYVRVSRNEFKTRIFAAEHEVERELRESVKTQIENGKTFCAERGWECEIYDRDSNQSGYDGEETRKDLQRLISDIRAGKIHTVITREHWRISRNAEFTEKFINLLFSNGVDYIGLDEPIDIRTPDGQMMLGIKGRMGQNYLSYISRKSKTNKTYLASKGGLITVGNCLGYKHVGRNKVEVVPDEAKIVKWLFLQRSKGMGVKEICRLADKLGYRAKQGHKFQTGSLTLFFKNPRYTGRIMYNGEIIPSPYPPIIPVDQFEKCQKYRQLNSPRRNSNRLSKILKCGVCGSSMSPRNCKGVKYYQCHKSKSMGGECVGTTFKLLEIWDFIDANIGLFAAAQFSALAESTNTEVLANIEAVESEIADLQTQKNELAGQYVSKELPASGYSLAITRIEEIERNKRRDLLSLQSKMPVAQADMINNACHT